MRNLAKVLDAVQRLVDQKDEDEPSPALHEESSPLAIVQPIGNPGLRLIGIKSMSAGYAVADPFRESVGVITQTGKAIGRPDRADWTQATLSSVKELSEVARSLGCVIEFRLPSNGRQLGDVIAKIGPSTFKDVSASAYITGPTSVLATLERVGGATEMHCGIRLVEQSRKMVICKVASVDLVRGLGNFIYQQVLLHGVAQWLRHGFFLRTMEVMSFEVPKTGSILDTLNRIYDAGGSAWDSVDDPDTEITEMRRS